ncbi:MAG: long-chain fatty acid--CoA ligase, partial [Acidobacteria bacterium]|nr:long-chain fatty acid--CoA ligase [Acidobacteriota bacterium]
IITAGGKNVAPAEVEPLLMEIDGISQAVLVGDRRPYLAALLTLDALALPALAESLGLAESTPSALADDPTLRAWLAERIAKDVNPRLASYQTVKRFDILPRELSPEEGEMTPTLKLRRAEIVAKHAERIDALYRASAPDPESARRSA